MAAYGVLAIKNPVTGLWHDNLNTRGFRVRHKGDDGVYRWILMTSDNTRIRNPEHDPKKHKANDPLYPAWLIPI